MFESDDGGGDYCWFAVDFVGNGGWFRGDELDCCVDDWWYDYCIFVVVVYYFGGV